MSNQSSTREVPVAALRPKVAAALAAIQQWRVDRFEKAKARCVERMNSSRWRKLLRRKPYTLEQADHDLRNDSPYGSTWGDLQITFGSSEDRLVSLLALCDQFDLKDHISVTAEDAEIISNWTSG